jgi:hypothetical protein
MDIKTLDDLLKGVRDWFQVNIPDSRTKTSTQRQWFITAMKWDKTLKLADLRKATDRTQLNTDYTTRFDEEDVKARKGISAIKIEISQLYSYNKCFVQRYKTRLQYYRDDLSQKGARNMYNTWQSHAEFQELKQNLDN